MPAGLRRLLDALSYPPQPPHDDASYADDEFWAAFEVDPDYVPRTPWYRKTARYFAALFIVGMIATGALIPWGEWLDRIDNVSDVAEITAIADDAVEESSLGWLVTDVRVRDIPDSTTRGYVFSNPPDGVITLDAIDWDPDEIRSTVHHEIGHLLDFAAYGDAAQEDRRDGLASEVWAECAAVDHGYRTTDSDGPFDILAGSPDEFYRCTDTELEQYRFSVSLLGEVCKTWGDLACRTVSPVS